MEDSYEWIVQDNDAYGRVCTYLRENGFPRRKCRCPGQGIKKMPGKEDVG